VAADSVAHLRLTAAEDPDDAGQTLVTYTAAAGSASETALNLLSTLGRDQDRGGRGDDDRVLEVRRG
jgi:hypothetical protein